jgi:molybdopterin molybdotransferase
MISFSEAQHLVIGQAKSFGKEKVSLDEAVGRVLAQTINADRDYPPFNRAAMDGYALKQSDWDNGLRSFVIREVIYAGSVETTEIKNGECYKIMTGAALPPSTNTVIRREDVIEEDNRIICSAITLNLYQHVARQGEDLKVNQVVCSEGILCSSPVIGALASLGNHEVMVEKLPRVAIITTGNEIVNINEPVNTVQIRNSNGHVLKALLKSWNIIPVSCAHALDEMDEIERSLQAALTNDIIITCGGVSAGDADYTPEALTRLGARTIFHKVAIRPGRPIWFGRFEEGAVVFALPGNPFSCMVTFKIFIELFLCYSFGVGKPNQFELPINTARSKKNTLDEFFPVKISGTPSCLDMVSFNGSGDITASLGAQAIARHPSELEHIPEGTILNCYPLANI